MAKKTVKKATKEPKGSITRDKLKFTAAWKIADADYKDGQQWTRKISYAVATTEASAIGASLTFTEASGDEITEPLGTSVTSRVIKVEANDYYPNTNKRLKKVSVKVKGKRKGHENSKTKYVYTWSKWSEFVFAVNAPKNPTFSAKPAALYQDDDRRSHFIVSATSVDDKNHNPVSRLQWESILVKNASTTDGSKQKWDNTVTGWRTGTTNTLSNYEVPIPTETIVPTDTDSWTRFVRVRAQGIGGDSAWVYNYHVYGKAYVPQVTEGDVGVGDGTLIIDADWTTPSDPSHPVDRITLQYCITEPAAGLTCPASASWTDAQVTGDTKAIDKAFYEVGQGLEDDQCLFYRVTAVHDNETSHSDPVLKYVGYLKQPTGLSVQINWQTKRATVTATNASGVADSFLAIYTNIGGYHCIGYIPHGQTSATVEIPDFANENNFAIGVRAVVGMWQNGLKPYAGKPLMESRNTLWQGGSVPKAPTNVTVEKTSVSGTVSVSWDWAWEDADSAQIAWSDNPLAWESTDEPSDYTITNLNPSRWYVAELATGQIWYFRVRLLQTNDDSITYGAWSDMVSINLSSAPNRPTLFLSDGVISADSMTKAYWAYVSTDTTPQAYAEICEATIDGGGITYGDPILHTQSEQHIDIYPNELGWTEGETHYLCVRVTSASGIPSEGWSEPVPLQIAAEMTCSITEDSLETQSIEVNPQTHSGNPITFTNPDGTLEFAKLRVDLEPTQEGTGDPSPSNVRPIHGVGSVEVSDVGINQWDEEWELGGIGSSNGVPYSTPNAIRAKNFSACLPNETYYFKGAFAVYWYNSSQGFISVDYVGNNTKVSPASARYFKIGCFDAYGTTYKNDISINYPPTDHDYHAYQEPIKITENLETTVYGGYVDLITGELVVDRAMTTFDGSTVVRVVKSGTSNALIGIDGLNPPAKTYAETVLPPIMCNGLKPDTPYNAWRNETPMVALYTSGNTAWLRMPNVTTVAQASAYLEENNIHFVYPLATPIRTILTSRELSALVGRNTLTANGNMQIRLAEGITETECLTRLPLTVTVTGAGDGGTTILAIERDGDYLMRRPDETEYTGHDGETIALLTQSGEDEMTVDLPSLIGYLDDGARYRIVATTKDAFGQTATDSIDFLVKWDEQAIIPDGVVEIDGIIAKLTPIAPSGVTDGAVCDIYRLSADRPELVYPNAEFGETYVDPYPAIGGGYRFVYKTKYGDYIDENDALAWLDIESEFEHDRMIVDFGGDSVELYYNIDEDDDWSKDFQSTQYLGGHIVGDWNPAVERTADISAVVITIIEEDTVDALRRLADYAGACHVRTLSGSSYTANVDVKRSKSHDHYGTRYSYGLKISKVDSQGYDGMPEDLYEVIS